MTGLKREGLIENFYTNPDVAGMCIKKFIEFVRLDENDLIIEPSAGNGSFSNILSTIHKNTMAYDLYPACEFIIQQDYLSLNIDDLIVQKKCKKIHTIGNPPFGRQSILAKKFIKKSSEHSDTISFILPKSFKKESLMKSFPLNYHLIFSMDLPYESFNINNHVHDVPCVFQIWIKSEENRLVEKTVPLMHHITYVKKSENPDFSIRRVGFNAGIISKNIDNSEQSNYYFKLTTNTITIDEFIDRYTASVIMPHNNTVGPKSISKFELTKC